MQHPSSVCFCIFLVCSLIASIRSQVSQDFDVSKLVTAMMLEISVNVVYKISLQRTANPSAWAGAFQLVHLDCGALLHERVICYSRAEATFSLLQSPKNTILRASWQTCCGMLMSPVLTLSHRFSRICEALFDHFSNIWVP